MDKIIQPGAVLQIEYNHAEQPINKLIPFLKWAGGKRWLRPNYPRIFPSKYSRYIEPFLGGGAVFFDMLPRSAILSDINADLIATYQAIRDDWQAVQAALEERQNNHSDEYFYEERARIYRTPNERAAQFLYLNRTCWNGLYRVNLKGRFNVPKGTKTNVVLSSDDFRSTSNALKGAILEHGDFEPVIDGTRAGDFVFIDPPYSVKHNVNGFVKYNEKIFRWDDQTRLASAVTRAAMRNVKMLITNANHASIRNLYSNVGHLKELGRSSVLAGDSNYRGKTTELAIMINFQEGE